MNLSLYAIAEEHRALIDQLDQMDIDEQTKLDTLEGERGLIESKSIAVAAFIRNIEAEAEAYDNHAVEMAGRAKSLNKKVDSLKKYLLDNMQRCGITEIKGGAIAIKLQKNPASVDVFEVDLVPSEFRAPPPPPFVPAPDKRAIVTALKAGQEVPGCRLIQTQRVVIK